MEQSSSGTYEIVRRGKEKYVNYKVFIRRNNEEEETWFVIRRYSEFRALFDILRKAYPEANFKIPPKKIFGNFSQSTIQTRVAGLNDLVNQILNTPGAFFEDCSKEFFGTDNPNNQPVPENEKPGAEESDYLGNEDDMNLFSKHLGPSCRKMSPKDFDFKKVIGKGSFGRVYLAKHLETGKIYAVKVLAKNKLKTDKEKHHLMSERNVLLNNLEHPFLVSLHYSFQTPAKLFFVLDYVNGGELFYHLQKEKYFDEERAKFYAAEIACALGYMHSKHIIYRDLKPENLLLDRYGHIVITDFGLAKERMDLQEGGLTRTFCGTPEYLAPEVLLKKPYTYALDWWCLGSVLYEMIFGVPPFYQKDHAAMYDAIKHKEVNFNRRNKKITSHAQDLLSKILNKMPEERLGFQDDLAELEAHPFFQSLDFKKLERKEIPVPFVPVVMNEEDISNIDKGFIEQPVGESVQKADFLAGVTPNTDHNFIGFSYAPPMANYMK